MHINFQTDFFYTLLEVEIIVHFYHPLVVKFFLLILKVPICCFAMGWDDIGTGTWGLIVEN